MRAFLVLLALSAALAGCDSDAFTVPASAVLVASTDRMDFGDVRVGTSAERTLRLTNAGGLELSIVAVAIDQELGAFGSGAHPRVLSGGASGELVVSFAPGTALAHRATLTIVTDTQRSPTLDVELVGVGIEGNVADAGVANDASVDQDAGVEPDAGPREDGGGARDSGTTEDSGVNDAGAAPDAEVMKDAGGPADASAPDARPPDASIDVWTPTSTSNAPSARDLHGAVWTGTQMIVFGARNGAGLTNGGRYAPSTDAWSPMSSAGAPSFHSWGQNGVTLIWTGTEVIAWNGYVGGSPQGGRYDPASNVWRSMSTVNQPGARRLYPYVWTGTEMIVWGGCDQLSTAFPDGARYDPVLDRWTTMSTTGAPAPRCAHVGVWTGSEMIVWGGLTTGGTDVSTGGRYNPTTNAWSPMSTTGAPSARRLHSGVWTGSELIVFGGTPTNATGGRYDPATDTWTPLPTAGAPALRQHHTAVWTGAEMVVWAGHDPPTTPAYDTGAKYDPVQNRWTPTTGVSAPAGRYLHTAVWTGTEMIVWGGANGTGGYHATGGRYRP